MTAANVIRFPERKPEAARGKPGAAGAVSGQYDLLAAAARRFVAEQALAETAAPPSVNAEMLRLLRRIDRTLAKLQGSLQRGDLRSKAG